MSLRVRVSKDGVEEVWKGDDSLSSHYNTPVPKDGYLYGIDGRQDVGVAALRSFDPKTGKIAWAQEGFGMASLILADGKLVIMKTNGELVLAKPDPHAYSPLATARVFESARRDPALALPALAGGLLYVRDTLTLKCLDLRR